MIPIKRILNASMIFHVQEHINVEISKDEISVFLE
jgi:hypothetical protein